MPPERLIDSTVVIDFLDNRRERHLRAQQLFDLAREGSVELALSSSGHIFDAKANATERLRELANEGVVYPGENAFPGAAVEAFVTLGKPSSRSRLSSTAARRCGRAGAACRGASTATMRAGSPSGGRTSSGSTPASTPWRRRRTPSSRFSTSPAAATSPRPSSNRAPTAERPRARRDAAASRPAPRGVAMLARSGCGASPHTHALIRRLEEALDPGEYVRLVDAEIPAGARAIGVRPI